MCDHSTTSRCLICTKTIASGSRRFGAQCCGACAAFFSRSIPLQASFICEGSNQCLREPCLLGKNCRRCRFDKCIEIGMSNHELNALPRIVPSTSSSISSSPSSSTTPANNNANFYGLENYSTYVKIIDQVCLTSMAAPTHLEAYLLGINGDIFNKHFSTISAAASIQERYYSLTFLLKRYPITDHEFPVFLYFCLCKINFPHLPLAEQIRLKNFQLICEQNFDPKIVFGQRLIELSNLAQNFYNVFKAFI